ncbi:hypothetical protein BDV37DRAFT_111460 [Aspergillus pseudonomiae]|uniref:Uncharacterized protein n=1 Tax=Aspergillus pseudonomiae TaxID=1506151 RepID=A0A5N7DSG5_9EURO|nr:uncharacterized protein BDV37DRAFT_111460 [Aspergillus pseudonomiae]KAE8409326.1 hypothetical protein BDV37DRAFT_111460 [Aspergillus pseudonomiae]
MRYYFAWPCRRNLPRDRAAERVDWNRVGHLKVKQILLDLTARRSFSRYAPCASGFSSNPHPCLLTSIEQVSELSYVWGRSVLVPVNPALQATPCVQKTGLLNKHPLQLSRVRNSIPIEAICAVRLPCERSVRNRVDSSALHVPASTPLTRAEIRLFGAWN